MVDGLATGRGPPRGDRARAARAVHRQLAGEPEERLDHADARLRADACRDRPADIWNWRTLDLRLVLERWTQAVPPERVHVRRPRPRRRRGTTSGTGSPASSASRPTGIDLSGSFPNTSMGVAEAETLRRVNGRLDGFEQRLRQGRLHPHASSPTSGWSRAAGRGSGPSRTRSRSAAAGARRPSTYLRQHADRRRRRPRAPPGARRARAAPAAPCRSPTPRWPRSPSTWSRPCSATCGSCGSGPPAPPRGGPAWRRGCAVWSGAT